jgi:N-sulfoglucosamine sulfohydrolase
MVRHICAVALFFSVVGGLLRAQSEPNPDQQGDVRPNILWLIAEDLGPELSCYGHPQVWTPNLDRLAAEGVLYTRAYTTAPVCSPSRSAFMTGMYQTSIDAQNHRSHRTDHYTLPEGVRVLPDWLRAIGYFTANVVQLSEDPEEHFFRGTGKTDWNFLYDGEPFDTDRWEDLADHQPFYAQINFSETHRGKDWDEAAQHIERLANPDLVRVPPYYPDDPATRIDWANYLNSAMALDRKIGFVIEQLRRDGLLENTVIFFFGDNGRAMIRGKQWPYESGLHVPLIVRWPSRIPKPDGFVPGSVDQRLVAAIDFPATTLAIAGTRPPLLMQGRVFLGSHADPPRRFVFGGRDRGDETVDRIRTVRDDRYRYIRNYYPDRPFLQLNRYKEWTYPVLAVMRKLHEQGRLDPVQERLFSLTRPGEELYDLDADPYEIHNLAGRPDYREVQQRLAAVLEAWLAETNDQGRIAEPPEIPAEWDRVMQETYEARPKKTLEIPDPEH